MTYNEKTGRSNYVTVTDKNKWNTLVNNHIISDDDGVESMENNKGQVNIIGVIAGYKYDNDELEFDTDIVYEKIQELLAPDQLFIYEEIGHEEGRDLFGDITFISKDAIDYHSLDKAIRKYKEEHPNLKSTLV